MGNQGFRVSGEKGKACENVIIVGLVSIRDKGMFGPMASRRSCFIEAMNATMQHYYNSPSCHLPPWGL